MKNLEIKTIEWKGIKVSVKIDYDKGTGSIVDASDGYQPKKWVFASRQVEYVRTWVHIIEAMAEGVKYIERELAQREKMLDRKMAQRMAAIAKADSEGLKNKRTK